MTQVFIVCACSVIKNSQEIGLFYFFHICSASLFMVLTSLSQLISNTRTQKLEIFLGCSLGISFNCSDISDRLLPLLSPIIIPVQLCIIMW